MPAPPSSTGIEGTGDVQRLQAPRRRERSPRAASGAPPSEPRGPLHPTAPQLCWRGTPEPGPCPRVPGAHSTAALCSWTRTLADPANVSRCLPWMLEASEAGQVGTQRAASRLSPGTHRADSLRPLFPHLCHLTSPGAGRASCSGLRARKPTCWARKRNYRERTEINKLLHHRVIPF